MAAGTPDRRVIALAIGIPVVLALVLLATSVLGGGDGGGPVESPADEGPTAGAGPSPVVDQDWDAAVAAAFEPLTVALPDYARAVAEWADGDRDDGEFAAVLDEVGPVAAQVVTRTAAVAPHRSDERAGALMTSAAELYVQAVAAHRAALAATDEDVREQWDRLGRRLRILGDRTFDRARERTSPPIDPGEGVDLRLPAEVPDFDRLELAVGPPLEPEGADVIDALPRLREAERRSQPLADWEEAVEALDAPTSQDVEDALDEADAEVLAGHGRRLVDAAEGLRTEPVPAGDRGRADRLAIGWLVLADAARAGQLAAVSETPGGVAGELLELARRSGLSAP